MKEHRFKIGQKVKCVGRRGLMTQLKNIRKGEIFVVTAVDVGVYSDKINVKKEHQEEEVCISGPILPGKDFEAI